MIKVMTFMVRNQNMTHDESVKYHREVHAPLAASVLGKKHKLLKKYHARYFDEVPGMAFDMLVEQWFEDEAWEKMKEFRKTQEYLQVLRQSTDKMVDREKVYSLVFQENSIV